jgi:CHAT domain-containing protein/tetratricopeptide (TPR) repeat protein
MIKWAAVLLVITGCTRQSPDSLYLAAQALMSQGKIKEAIEKIDAGSARDPSWRFRLLRAEALLRNGEAEQATSVLDATPAPSSTADRARAAMFRGYAKFLLSDYQQADKLYDAAQALNKPASDPLLEAEIAVRRGYLRMRQDHPAEAEQLFRQTLIAAKQQGSRRLEADATGNLGVLLLVSYRYDAAIYWLEQARADFEHLGSATDVGRALGNLGWCYFRLGDVERASSYMRQAEASAQASGNRHDQQTWLGALAGILAANGDLRGAADTFRQALAIAREVKDRYFVRQWAESLAVELILLGDLDAAEAANREAMELAHADKTQDLFVLLNEARIAALRGKTAQAVSIYTAVLARRSDDPTPLLDAYSDLADLLVRTGDPAGADREYRASLDQIGNGQAVLAREEFRLTYLSSLIRFCDQYVDFLVTRGETGRALEVTESIRARVLNERAASEPGTSPAVSVGALEHAAGVSHSVFLSYWLSPQHAFLWVIRPDSVKLYRLPPAKQIASLVEDYRSFVENLGDPLEAEYPAGAQLSHVLLDPVRADLLSGAKIVIAPDRNLHSLNFEALPDPNDPKHYLIEQARISVAPSLAMIASQSPAVKATHGPILLIGDPEPIGHEYPRLPHAALEMELVGQSYPLSQQLVITGARAAPGAYLEASPVKFSAIHFAAHATANRESPLDSALILSPSASGYELTARQVMTIPLHASLVTLSACRSAGAKTYSGEGLVGLSWAFLRAGAGSVVAGLWDVTDQSTAKLMGDFYGQMTAGATPADALRAAKLKLVHSQGAFKKPFYWAPFQLYAGRL